MLRWTLGHRTDSPIATGHAERSGATGLGPRHRLARPHEWHGRPSGGVLHLLDRAETAAS